MSDVLDWSEIENLLFDLAIADIASFATAHPDEAFYGFAFDCNADYGQALLCLNTPEHLELASRGEHLPAEVSAGYEKLRKKLGLVPDRTPPDERAKELRWSLGAWKYQDFNSPRFDQSWMPIQKQIRSAAFPDVVDESQERMRLALAQEFLKTVCRVLIRLESSGAFDSLNKTGDFQAGVFDHDEWEATSWERLDSVRKG